MKKLLFILTINVCTFCFSQETYKVYESTNGVPNVTPSKEVITQNGTTKVYEYTNGVRNITPSVKLVPQNNRVNMYQYNNGIPSVTPTKVIVPVTPNFTYPNYGK